MRRNNLTSRLLWATSNDAILLLLAYLGYRNNLWSVAILFVGAAIFSTAYVLLRKPPNA